MVFPDDEGRVGKDHAPANFATVKHMACNLLQNAKEKASVRLKRKVAAWDEDFLENIISS